MSRSMLRAAVVVAGLLLLAGAATLAVAGCPPGAVLRVGLPGLLLLAAILGERWRYQRLQRGRPDRKWIATAERFVDLETGAHVSVYYQPATGKRRYVTT